MLGAHQDAFVAEAEIQAWAGSAQPGRSARRLRARAPCRGARRLAGRLGLRPRAKAASPERRRPRRRRRRPRTAAGTKSSSCTGHGTVTGAFRRARPSPVSRTRSARCARSRRRRASSACSCRAPVDLVQRRGRAAEARSLLADGGQGGELTFATRWTTPAGYPADARALLTYERDTDVLDSAL